MSHLTFSHFINSRYGPAYRNNINQINEEEKKVSGYKGKKLIKTGKTKLKGEMKKRVRKKIRYRYEKERWKGVGKKTW